MQTAELPCLAGGGESSKMCPHPLVQLARVRNGSSSSCLPAPLDKTILASCLEVHATRAIATLPPMLKWYMYYSQLTQIELYLCQQN